MSTSSARIASTRSMSSSDGKVARQNVGSEIAQLEEHGRELDVFRNDVDRRQQERLLCQHGPDFVERRVADPLDPLANDPFVEQAGRPALVECHVDPRVKMEPPHMLAQRGDRHRFELVFLRTGQQDHDLRQRFAVFEPQLVIGHDLPGPFGRQVKALAVRHAGDEGGQIELVPDHPPHNPRGDAKRRRVRLADGPFGRRQCRLGARATGDGSIAEGRSIMRHVVLPRSA